MIIPSPLSDILGYQITIFYALGAHNSYDRSTDSGWTESPSDPTVPSGQQEQQWFSQWGGVHNSRRDQPLQPHRDLHGRRCAQTVPLCCPKRVSRKGFVRMCYRAHVPNNSPSYRINFDFPGIVSISLVSSCCPAAGGPPVFILSRMSILDHFSCIVIYTAFISGILHFFLNWGWVSATCERFSTLMINITFQRGAHTVALCAPSFVVDVSSVMCLKVHWGYDVTHARLRKRWKRIFTGRFFLHWYYRYQTSWRYAARVCPVVASRQLSLSMTKPPLSIFVIICNWPVVLFNRIWLVCNRN